MTAAGALKLASGGSALVAFQTPQDEVQAFDAPITATSAGRDGRRHGAGDALADARRAGDVRRVHAGHREGLLRDHDRDGDLDRG